jgi:hypothetical protein
MMKSLVLTLAMTLAPFGAFAVDGVVLINQSTVLAAGGFPYKITQPGSYRLTGNLVAGLNQFAIQIVAPNVVLDLNGFNVQCSADSNIFDQAACIGDGGAIAPTHNVAIRNGTVLFTESGPHPGAPHPNIIGVGFSNSDRVTIENLDIEVNRDSGVGSFAVAVGAKSIVRHNILSASGVVACPSIVDENVSTGVSIGTSGAGCVYINNTSVF